MNVAIERKALEQWRRRLDATERTRQYAEEKKELRMEKYADGGDGAKVRMMVRGDSLVVRACPNVAWRYEEDDRNCTCGELETERHVLLECPLYDLQRMEWLRRWRIERGEEDPMRGVIGSKDSTRELDQIILDRVGRIWRERQRLEGERNP
eukprot:GHVO01039596.1.p1 GENE.GHVO01039596.1~~GHVO01039596.1.p1  ORF type:complete len:152 (-),score=27.19 GHVO01039596.1:289-744(-)